jgi:hypothetical protein
MFLSIMKAWAFQYEHVKQQQTGQGDSQEYKY